MARIFFSDSDLIGARVIRLVTWSDVSHCGLIDDDDNVIDSRLAAGGVTQYKLSELQHRYPRLIVKDIPQLPNAVFELAKTQIGKPYDWTALVGMGFHRNWQQDDRWFCSELVAWACAQAGVPLINKVSWRITPQDLFESIK